MQMMKRLDWKTVALIAIAVVGMVSTLAIVLMCTPDALLMRLLETNWPAAVTAAMTTAIALYGMARRAGLVHPLAPEERDEPPLDDMSDEPTSPMGPRAMRRRDDPPGDRS